MNYPKISIVTPSFNQAHYLEQTILSIVGQNYPHLEYIIIDGGSTDSSVEIIKKYEKYLAYWESAKDKGHYYAVQKGLEKSTGEIMTYLNSDDILYPYSLFIIAELFQSYPQIQWIHGIPAHIDEQGKTVRIHTLPKWNKYRYYRYDYKFIQQEGTFWHRNLWEKAGGYISTDYELASDLELWLRFFQYADFYAINTLIGAYRLRSANQKSLEQLEAYCKEAENILSNHQLSEQERKELQRIQLIERTLLKVPILKDWKWLQDRFYYNSLVFRFPPTFDYDRIGQKFFLK